MYFISGKYEKSILEVYFKYTEILQGMRKTLLVVQAQTKLTNSSLNLDISTTFKVCKEHFFISTYNLALSCDMSACFTFTVYFPIK